MKNNKNNKFIQSINIFCVIIMALFLISMSISAVLSGHAWSITCYYCKQCNRYCPQGIDAAGFVTSALSGNPNLLIDVDKGHRPLKRFYKEVPDIKVYWREEIKALKEIDINDIPQNTMFKIPPGKMKAYYVAFVCQLCPDPAPCEAECPIDLPIKNITKDLRDDGKFNGSHRKKTKKH
jgi:ferredoxin